MSDHAGARWSPPPPERRQGLSTDNPEVSRPQPVSLGLPRLSSPRTPAQSSVPADSHARASAADPTPTFDVRPWRRSALVRQPLFAAPIDEPPQRAAPTHEPAVRPQPAPAAHAIQFPEAPAGVEVAPATAAGYAPRPSMPMPAAPSVAAMAPAERDELRRRALAPAAPATLAGLEQSRGITSNHIIALLVGLAIIWIIAASGQSTRPALDAAANLGKGTTATLGLPYGSNGIPSPAAAASIREERAALAKAPADAETLKLEAADAPAIKMKGIPSPAAAASLAPQTLGKSAESVADPGVPTSLSMRDDHAVEAHYRGSGEVVTETLPLTTPGAVTAEPTEPAVTPEIEAPPAGAEPVGENTAF